MKKKIIITITTIIAATALGAVFGSCAPAGEGLADTQDEAIEEETDEQTAVVRAEVVIENTSYQPRTLTVSPGTTVTWVNNDDFVHTVVSGTSEAADSGTMFDSGDIAAGETFEFTFQEQGTFDYFCDIHSGMDGQVIVEEGTTQEAEDTGMETETDAGAGIEDDTGTDY